MATTRSFTSTYSGDAIRAYILKALIGGETLSTDGLNIQTGVKYKRVIKKFTSTDIIQSGGCDFTPAGTLTISEGVLEPQKIKINEQICFEDLYTLWDAEEMAEGMNNEDVPQPVIDAMVEEFVGQTQKAVEEMIWQGDVTGGTGTVKDLIDGYERLLKDGNEIRVTGTTLSGSNIVTEMNKCIEALPAGVKSKRSRGELVFFVSHKAAFLYEQNLAAQGDNTTAVGQSPSIYGIEVKAVGGLSSDDVMVLGARDNFYFGTDAMSDWNDLKALDQRDVDGSEYVNFVLKGKLDVAIGFTSEVVHYY
jgi:hypothetical protein